MIHLAASLARHLSGIAEVRPDGELLAAFLRDRDEMAFAELVRRHGPLVWSACRRLLPDPADAEDAFQASFLVLVRRARRLTGRPELGPWLYQVAVWTARNLRRRNARRLARRQPLGDAADAAPGPTAFDLQADLDAALLSLPEKYRTPLVLCHLQGWSRREAAARLGCPEGTLSSLLARGLERLRVKLKGFDPTKAMAVAPAVPLLVANAAVKAAVGAHLATAVAVSATVSQLAEGVIRMFWIKKATAASVALVAVFGFGMGIGVSVRQMPGAAAGDGTAVAAKVETPSATPQKIAKPQRSGTEKAEVPVVIPLKVAASNEAVVTLTEIFNDGDSKPAAGKTPLRIRIVSDPHSNSLIILKASPMDLATIRKLVEKVIDKKPAGNSLQFLVEAADQSSMARKKLEAQRKQLELLIEMQQMISADAKIQDGSRHAPDQSEAVAQQAAADALAKLQQLQLELAKLDKAIQLKTDKPKMEAIEWFQIRMKQGTRIEDARIEDADLKKLDLEAEKIHTRMSMVEEAMLPLRMEQEELRAKREELRIRREQLLAKRQPDRKANDRPAEPAKARRIEIALLSKDPMKLLGSNTLEVGGWGTKSTLFPYKLTEIGADGKTIGTVYFDSEAMLELYLKRVAKDSSGPRQVRLAVPPDAPADKVNKIVGTLKSAGLTQPPK